MFLSFLLQSNLDLLHRILLVVVILVLTALSENRQKDWQVRDEQSFLGIDVGDPGTPPGGRVCQIKVRIVAIEWHQVTLIGIPRECGLLRYEW